MKKIFRILYQKELSNHKIEKDSLNKMSQKYIKSKNRKRFNKERVRKSIQVKPKMIHERKCQKETEIKN